MSGRPCQHTSRPRVVETRDNSEGGTRRRLQCHDCGERWTEVDVQPPRHQGPPLSAGKAILEYLEANPGAFTKAVAMDLGRDDASTIKRMTLLSARGLVIRIGHRLWVAKHANLAAQYQAVKDATPKGSKIIAPAPPEPAPRQAAPYVGAIVPPRRPPDVTPERVEYRTIDGRRVKVTICPSARESAAPLLFSVPRVRTNLSSQWGGL